MLKSKEKGLILVSVALLMSALALLGTAAMLSTVIGLQLGSNYRLSQEVLYIAQAGAEYGLNRLRAAVLISPLNTSSVVPPTIAGYTFENTGSFLALSGGSVQKTVTGQYERFEQRFIPEIWMFFPIFSSIAFRFRPMNQSRIS